MRQSRVRILLAGAAVTAGVAAILLPFTFGTSPGEATFDGSGYWPIALPFYLALPIGWASLPATSRLAPGRLRVGGWIAAVTAAAMTTSFILRAAWSEPPSYLREWVTLAAPVGLLVAGAALALHRRHLTTPASIVAMQVAYVANASLCLLAFAGDWQPGAWCALATGLIYVEQIAWRPWRDAWSWRDAWVAM